MSMPLGCVCWRWQLPNTLTLSVKTLLRYTVKSPVYVHIKMLIKFIFAGRVLTLYFLCGLFFVQIFSRELYNLVPLFSVEVKEAPAKQPKHAFTVCLQQLQKKCNCTALVVANFWTAFVVCCVRNHCEVSGCSLFSHSHTQDTCYLLPAAWVLIPAGQSGCFRMTMPLGTHPGQVQGNCDILFSSVFLVKSKKKKYLYLCLFNTATFFLYGKVE